MKCIVTGGAGFIGSSLVKHLIENYNANVLNIDKLTYAGRIENLEHYYNHKNHSFLKLDILDFENIKAAINNFKPDVVFHLAAESHVDNSIQNSFKFVNSNVVGTHMLLEACLDYFKKLPLDNKPYFRFVHVSTDEVFGTLGKTGQFSEKSRYAPNSPYAASKASSDLLVRSYYKTYKMPIIITNCSNNYGPNQYPEKLIPKCILNAQRGRELPIYGTGIQVRDWLYVDDHVSALAMLALDGRTGESYCIGGDTELSNISLINMLCEILDEFIPSTHFGKHINLVQHVIDRQGHDYRYSTDTTKIRKEINWFPKTNFQLGLKKTVEWYLNNTTWFRESLRKEA